MAQLRERDRARLPDSAFAYIDATGRRMLPIHDEAHVRNALARFGRVVFDDETARDRARTRLLRAAKRHGIVPIGFVTRELRPEANLPTGRVTLLMADIEGSTGHVAVLGDGYTRLIGDLRRILRGAVRRAGGHEVDARADEYFAAFGSTPPALAAARAIQAAITDHGWPDGRPVRVRIGLHAGRPTLTPSGYVGIAVNTASRVCAAGNGGRIIVSGAVRAGLDGPDGAIGVRPLGSHRLAGVPDPVELWEAFVVPDGPAADGSPALRLANRFD